MDLKDIRSVICCNMAVKNIHTLEVNQTIEGNSYFGVCIFIGLAKMFGFEDTEIEDFVSVDAEEREFMQNKFLKYLTDYFEDEKSPNTTAKRFYTKVNLILNGVKINHNKVVTLADIIKDNIK
tara:strand:- start:120 stop:488 length:369 start_codon:yes stop_codon:yes gene_type:complete